MRAHTHARAAAPARAPSCASARAERPRGRARTRRHICRLRTCRRKCASQRRPGRGAPRSRNSPSLGRPAKGIAVRRWARCGAGTRFLVFTTKETAAARWSTVSRQGTSSRRCFSSCRHTVRAARQGGRASAQCAISRSVRSQCLSTSSSLLLIFFTEASYFSACIDFAS